MLKLTLHHKGSCTHVVYTAALKYLKSYYIKALVTKCLLYRLGFDLLGGDETKP